MLAPLRPLEEHVLDEVRDPRAWLVTAAWRKHVDAVRSELARQGRELAVEREPPPGPVPTADDSLQLYFLCAHPTLPTASAVALTLRAVGGLTTRQIAEAYLIPEATMAQRISRAKQRVKAGGARFTMPTPEELPSRLRSVLHVLYLVFNEGYSGDVDLAAEAIRIARQLTRLTDEPEVAGLLALMLLHHARRASRTGPGGRLVPLGQQDRSRWDTALIAEGVAILQAALARDRLGEYQAQAAIAALHAEAATPAQTDWQQIVGLYCRLLDDYDTPVLRLNRAAAVAMAAGPEAGLALLAEPALSESLAGYHLFHAAQADLLRRAGRPAEAAEAYRSALSLCGNAVERRYLERRLAEVGA